MLFRIFLIVCIVAAGISLRTDDDSPNSVPALAVDSLPEKIEIVSVPLGFSHRPEIPDDNLITADKVALGRKLFFDPILSKDHSIACASCHRPESGFANSQRLAIGIEGKAGTRNVPTILNRGFGKHFTWDGKASTLEEQVLTPIKNPNEMGNDVETVIADLRKIESYVSEFSKVFGDSDAPQRETISAENLAKSIAAFERVLVYGNTMVDRFHSGEYTALSRKARQGMWIFESRGRCWKCHGGENFTDEDFHNTGVGSGDQNRDKGRFEQTQNEKDKYKFKTPTLRGTSLTAPYMHDGSRATLKDVVEFYNEGGSTNDPALDHDIRPLNLSEEEVGFLVEFLKALSQ